MRRIPAASSLPKHRARAILPAYPLGRRTATAATVRPRGLRCLEQRMQLQSTSDTVGGVRTCLGCGRSLPLDQFGQRSNRCRPCVVAHTREWKAANPARVREQNQRWHAAHPGYYNRWREANPSRAEKRKKRDAYPEQVRARSAINYEVRAGRIERQPCVKCGDLKTEAHHHHGYDQDHWLNVVWLCRAHHKQVHTGSAMVE